MAAIGLCPPEAAITRERLWAALAEAYGVTFEPRERNALRGLDGVILILSDDDDGEVGRAECPSLVCAPPATRLQSPSLVRFSSSNALDARLRARSLHEDVAPATGLAAHEGYEVLATRDGEPVWLRNRAGSHPVDVIATLPDELGRDEPLKLRLRAGCFLSLLPLIEFLKQVVGPELWHGPEPHALIMFDDPNLRWRSYGYIDYRELLRHALEHNYHAAMAMIPIDTFPVDPRAARLFAASEGRLSLLMHGIHHERLELMKPLDAPVREALMVRALTQIHRFEARWGLEVARVMCAPHGEVSPSFLNTMLRSGIEAVFADLPFPWLGDRPMVGPPLVYWSPASFAGGGIPLIPRYPFAYDQDEVVLRAYLGHPLVLYGHHDDLAGGLDALAKTAALVNDLGGYEWASARSLARGNYATLREGETLKVRLLARRVELTVPPGITALEVELPSIHGTTDQLELSDQSRTQRVELRDKPTKVTIPAHAGTTELELRALQRVSAGTISPAPLRPWPVIRRALTETRDRVTPLVR